MPFYFVAFSLLKVICPQYPPHPTPLYTSPPHLSIHHFGFLLFCSKAAGWDRSSSSSFSSFSATQKSTNFQIVLCACFMMRWSGFLIMDVNENRRKADNAVIIVSSPHQINSRRHRKKEKERKISASDVLFIIITIPQYLPRSHPTPPTAVWSVQKESSRPYYRRVYVTAFTPFAAVCQVGTANRLRVKNSDGF